MKREDWHIDPVIESDDARIGRVVLAPVVSLSAHQLRLLMRVFELGYNNLIEAKHGLCDGQEHLLSSRIWDRELTELQAELDDGNIPYRVEWRPADPWE